MHIFVSYGILFFLGFVFIFFLYFVFHLLATKAYQRVIFTRLDNQRRAGVARQSIRFKNVYKL